MTSMNVTKHTTNESKNSYLATLKNLEHRVENIFENVWHNPFSHEDKPVPFAISVFEDMPKLDMVEKKKEILVKAELPGFSKKDIDVTIIGNRLVIKANTCNEAKVEEGNYLKQEISSSKVYRSLALPADVIGEKVKKTFKNGILKLRIPKMKKS
jgi:HSP20 family protein